MIIKKAEWKKCGECGSREQVSGEEYGCDACKKPIDIYAGSAHREFLGVTVFPNPNSSGTRDLQFCSWVCLLNKLRRLRCKYFIDLPLLHYDDAVPEGQRAKDFFEAIK